MFMAFLISSQRICTVEYRVCYIYAMSITTSLKSRRCFCVCLYLSGVTLSPKISNHPNYLNSEFDLL
jgi:hypothetical protein